MSRRYRYWRDAFTRAELDRRMQSRARSAAYTRYLREIYSGVEAMEVKVIEFAKLTCRSPGYNAVALV